MPPTSIRRLSLADLDDEALRALVGHGEHLFVERKVSLPSAGIGRVVASFANGLGGWVLLGVADDGSTPGFALPARTDAQSHLGQLLANEVEPPPPFVAAVRTLDGVDLTVIRVFESSDTPHLLKRTGAVPIRTPKGTEQVTDQDLLLQLARRGEEALERARGRLSSDLIARELSVPERPDLVAVSENEPIVIVRAGLVTAPPHFAEWATSRASPAVAERAALEIARILGATVEPGGLETSARGRGVAVGWTGGFQVPIWVRVAIDAGGVVGARIARGRGLGNVTIDAIRSEYVSPLMLALTDVLAAAGVYGRTVWRVDIGLPRQDFVVAGAPRRPGPPFFASGELSSPPTFDDTADLTDRFVREFAREMGLPQYE